MSQWFATGRWFSPSTQVSSTKKTYRYYMTEILLKVALNTITHSHPLWQAIKGFIKYKMGRAVFSLEFSRFLKYTFIPIYMHFWGPILTGLMPTPFVYLTEARTWINSHISWSILCSVDLDKNSLLGLLIWEDFLLYHHC